MGFQQHVPFSFFSLCVGESVTRAPEQNLALVRMQFSAWKIAGGDEETDRAG